MWRNILKNKSSPKSFGINSGFMTCYGNTLMYHVANHIMTNTCIINNVSMNSVQCEIYSVVGNVCYLPVLSRISRASCLQMFNKGEEKRREEKWRGFGWAWLDSISRNGLNVLTIVTTQYRHTHTHANCIYTVIITGPFAAFKVPCSCLCSKWNVLVKSTHYFWSVLYNKPYLIQLQKGH